MLRRAVLTTVVALSVALGAAACGDDDDGNGDSPDIATLFPADNAIGSWIEDVNATGFNGPNPTGVETASNNTEAVAFVNGDAVPFENHGFVALGREFYTDGTSRLELRIWEFPSAAVATTLYTELPNEDARYDNTWNTASFGDGARMIDTGADYWYNAHSGAYFIDLMGLSPNDAATQTAGEAFLSAVIADLP